MIAADALACTIKIARLVSNYFEYIGADIPPTQGMKIPIGFNGADVGVMVVVLLVCGSMETFWNSPSKQDGKDTVANVIAVRRSMTMVREHSEVSLRVVLVKGEQDKCSSHKVLVGK